MRKTGWKKLWVTLMAGAWLFMGGDAMAAKPEIHVDAATKNLPGHVASKQLEVQIEKPEILLISNVVYEQVPSRGYSNVPMQMDILKPRTGKICRPLFL